MLFKFSMFQKKYLCDENKVLHNNTHTFKILRQSYNIFSFLEIQFLSERG